MLMIRLSPTGRRGRISYRVVVSEKRSKLVGKTIDDVGFYNTETTPKTFQVNRKKIADWQAQGAQLSPTVKKLMAE